MNTSNLRFAAILASVCSIVSPSVRAADSAPEDDNFDASQFFHLGEIVAVNDTWRYEHTIADQIETRFQQYSDLAKKLGAPSDVLKAIEDYHKTVAKMPVSKEYGDLSSAEQTAWMNSNQHTENIKTWLDKGDYQKMFFFYLGWDAMQAWYAIAKSVSDDSATVASEKGAAKTNLTSFGNLATDSGYVIARKRLSPEAVADIKKFTDIKKQLDDPLSGTELTADMIKDMGDAGEDLCNLNKSGTLLAK